MAAMPAIHIPPSWLLKESEATPEHLYWNRRSFLAAAGLLLAGCEADDPLKGAAAYVPMPKRNELYKLDRPLTKAKFATSFNNYYEFTTDKTGVWPLAQKLTIQPWQIEIAGHCKRTGKVDIDDLLKKLPQEERLYRFRCVETWAMTVPWIGIPMKKFLDWVQPTGRAKYVRFVTVWNPKEMPGRDFRDQFPYYEALRIDEAANELTLLATGMFGRRMPKQNGAPIRVIVPWKYGYKSCKSIVRIEFVETQPKTFWNDYAANEYGFYSNVNPERPHPRWSQANEWMLPTQRDKRPTLKFNGYGEQVAALYRGMDLNVHH